jgi:hypothetical protein
MTGIAFPICERAPSFLDDIPSCLVLHGRLAPSGSAGYCLLFRGMVACHYKWSLPAQFPMKSVDTAATDGLGLVPARAAIVGNVRAQRVRCANGRRRASCAIDATIAGEVLR